MNPKIIATIGPSSENYEMLKKMALAGMNIVRVNFSHASQNQWKEIQRNLLKIKKETGLEVKMMFDLQGPRIRLGILPHEIEIIAGKTYTLVTGKANLEANELPFDYPSLYKYVKKDEPLYIANRAVELKVLKIQGKNIVTVAIQGGIIQSRKGINIPKTNIVGVLTKKDIIDAMFATKNGAHYICLSFVQEGKDVIKLRKLLKNDNIKIIAKIERASALKNIDDIIRNSNGLMVARGDLGIEMPIEELSIIQKDLIRHAHQYMRPAIVATEMLASMSKNPFPTRAEAADVANAVFDGADALMLSDETASGKYPLETVITMKKIVKRVDEYFNTTNYFDKLPLVK